MALMISELSKLLIIFGSFVNSEVSGLLSQNKEFVMRPSRVLDSMFCGDDSV